MSALKKLSSAINPFFSWFTTPYTMGVLVGTCMVVGVLGGFVLNMRCNEVVSVNINYEKFTGDLVLLKIWVETKHARPTALPSNGIHAATKPCLDLFPDSSLRPAIASCLDSRAQCGHVHGRRDSRPY